MESFIDQSRLARDDRFTRVPLTDLTDETRKGGLLGIGRIAPNSEDGPSRIQWLIHSVFVGELQAMEAAGRTAWDFRDAPDIPFQLKLDLARQTWDEARHCEISLRLLAHTGVEVGEVFEHTLLFEAGCSDDVVLRLAGVNRALEGLAIDVFNSLKEFGRLGGDPVLAFAEDWMLTDEITHVKFGSIWLQALTESDPDRRERALAFQRTVDRLFGLTGVRGPTASEPVSLARDLRILAGFTEAEVAELEEGMKESAREGEKARRRAIIGRTRAALGGP